jgi:hypothetical protein
VCVCVCVCADLVVGVGGLAGSGEVRKAPDMPKWMCTHTGTARLLRRKIVVLVMLDMRGMLCEWW